MLTIPLGPFTPGQQVQVTISMSTKHFTTVTVITRSDAGADDDFTVDIDGAGTGTSTWTVPDEQDWSGVTFNYGGCVEVHRVIELP